MPPPLMPPPLMPPPLPLGGQVPAIGLWAILPVELLHGVTYAINSSAITAHCARVAPPGMASTTQQLVNTLNWGIARGIGASAGGLVLARAGGGAMYRVGAMAAAGSLALTGVGASLFGRELLGRGVKVVDFPK